MHHILDNILKHLSHQRAGYIWVALTLENISLAPSPDCLGPNLEQRMFEI